MVPQYVRESDNLPAKMFREDYYTSYPELEIGITEILADNKDNKELEITVRMVKNKMHELLYNEGMKAFEVRKATTAGKAKCKEMFPEFYGEMKELPVKKSAPKKETEEQPAKKTAAKKTVAKKDAASKKAETTTKAKKEPQVYDSSKINA